MSASTSPLPYTGNKSCIAETILSVMPNHSVYIEPCMGSAEIFFRKRKAEKEILNDFNGDLINTFRVLQDDEKLALFLGRLCLSLNSEQIFKENKELLKNTPNILDDTLEIANSIHELTWEDVKSAIAFFENQVYSFSSTGQTFGIAQRDILTRIPRLLSANKRLKDATILHRDYKDVIAYAACPDAFILLDPPYKGTEGMYPKADFDGNQHATLFDLMADVDQKFHGKCRFLITYGNDQYIRWLAQEKGFCTFIKPRLDNMRQSTDAGVMYEELLIANYDLEKQAAENHRFLQEQNTQLTLFDYRKNYLEE